MPPPPVLPLPRLHYIVAGNKRAGTSLLCDGLRQCGTAGDPREYFGATQRPRWERRWDLPLGLSLPAYMQEVFQRTATRNGIVGLKLHYQQLVTWRFALRQEHLGDLALLWPQGIRYVQVVRRDTLAQAISYYRAETSGVWFRWQGTDARLDGPRPCLNVARIQALREAVQHDYAGWDRYFARWTPPVLTITYEDLDAAYPRTLRQVVDWLEVAPGDGAMPPPRLARQRDTVSAAWYAQLQEAT